MHAFLWTVIKILIASLVVGVILNHFGITPDELIRYSGTTRERLEELARQGIAWALPNLMLGAIVIVPVWFVVYLFRPPGPSRSSRE
jgi:hypothetical protein